MCACDDFECKTFWGAKEAFGIYVYMYLNVNEFSVKSRHASAGRIHNLTLKGRFPSFDGYCLGGLGVADTKRCLHPKRMLYMCVIYIYVLHTNIMPKQKVETTINPLLQTHFQNTNKFSHRKPKAKCFIEHPKQSVS